MIARSHQGAIERSLCGGSDYVVSTISLMRICSAKQRDMGKKRDLLTLVAGTNQCCCVAKLLLRQTCATSRERARPKWLHQVETPTGQHHALVLLLYFLHTTTDFAILHLNPNSHSFLGRFDFQLSIIVSEHAHATYSAQSHSCR